MGKLVPSVFNLVVVIYVALGSTACSYGMAVIGSTIGQPSFYKTLKLAPPGADGYSQTARWIGAFNGVHSAGSAIGSLAVAYLASKFGRKRCIQSGNVVLIIGAILCAAAVNASMFTIVRLINGLGIGVLVTSIPMYQAEVSTPESRGFMVSMHGIMFAVGYSLQGWLSFGVYFMGSGSSFPWRFPIAFQIIPSAIVLLGSQWLPFSPRWLIIQGRSDEALDVLKRLHRTPGDPEDRMANTEFFQIKKQTESDLRRKAEGSKWQIFAAGANRRRAFVGFFLMFNNQFTGVLIIANYGIILYTSLGMTSYWPLLLTCLWVTSTLPGNIFCALYVERFGRRRFMLTGLCGILMVLIFEALLQALYLGGNNKAGQNAAIFFIFLFITPFWSFCLDASQFLYVAEIFPNHLRAEGGALSTSGLYLAAMTILVAGPIALDNIGWKFFLVLIVPTFFNILFVYFFCPETKNKSLEEIAAQFGEKIEVSFAEAMAKVDHETSHVEMIGNDLGESKAMS